MPTNLTFRPLHPDFGAEVVGLDLASEITNEILSSLREAYDHYHLLYFSSTSRISADRQIEISKWFGPPWPVSERNVGLDDGELYSIFDNDEPYGSVVLPFHIDLFRTPSPCKAMSLYAINLPDVPTHTSFISGIAGWNKLPEELKSKLSSFTTQNKPKIGPLPPEFNTAQPIKFIHPKSGQPILAVTSTHSEIINELDPEESQDMLNKLFAHLYAHENQYSHTWKKNDLLIWDNLALQHARLQPAHPSDGPRIMRRLIMNEIGPKDMFKI